MNIKNSTKKPVSGLAFFISTLCIAWIAWPDDIVTHTPEKEKSPTYKGYNQNPKQKTYINKPFKDRGNFYSQEAYPNYRQPHTSPAKPRYQEPRYSQAKSLQIDINAADSLDWVQIPGIGPKTAQRILSYRKKLRGFHSISQLLEVYYFDSNLLQSNRVQFQVEPLTWRGLNWDSIRSKEDLFHPYLTSSERNSLWSYKIQHPEFHPMRSPKPRCIDSQTWLKLQPYWR